MSTDKGNLQFDLSTPGEEPGERKNITINGIDFVFRWCPPGTFLMGEILANEFTSFSNLKDASKETFDQHQVKLTKGFWILQTAVTQKQWQAVMGNNPSFFKTQGEDRPVENVSWNDCLEFCKTCLQFGLNVTLPTEAQWEYACRAGTNEPFSGKWDKMTWCDGKKNNGKKRYKTLPVGKLAPNEWRLYDMHGNIWEWCLDWYGAYPCESVTDPTGPSNGVKRVNRGGCFSVIYEFCRSAYRRSRDPNTRNCLLGFRIVGQ